MRAAWLILILSAGSCIAQSLSVCPWLSKGSAANALGGPVELDMHLENNLQGTCRFLRGSGNDQGSIEIIIGNVDTHACLASSPKKIGLGNEAVECKSSDSSGLVLETIAGRVRDVYFVVSVKNTRAGSAASPATMPRGEPDHPPILDLIAEQVVGNLY